MNNVKYVLKYIKTHHFVTKHDSFACGIFNIM